MGDPMLVRLAIRTYLAHELDKLKSKAPQSCVTAFRLGSPQDATVDDPSNPLFKHYNDTDYVLHGEDLRHLYNCAKTIAHTASEASISDWEVTSDVLCVIGGAISGGVLPVQPNVDNSKSHADRCINESMAAFRADNHTINHEKLLWSALMHYAGIVDHATDINKCVNTATVYRALPEVVDFPSACCAPRHLYAHTAYAQIILAYHHDTIAAWLQDKLRPVKFKFVTPADNARSWFAMEPVTCDRSPFELTYSVLWPCMLLLGSFCQTSDPVSQFSRPGSHILFCVKPDELFRRLVCLQQQ